MIAYLLLGITYGFAAGAQPGQLQAFLIGRTVAHGWRSTLPAALAPVVSDAPIIALVLFVLARIPLVFLHVLRAIGGVFLLYLAWTTAVAYRAAATPASGSPGKTLIEAALLNLLNPNPYLGWSLVMGPLCLEAWRRAPANAVALVAAFYGTMVIVSAAIVIVFASARVWRPAVPGVRRDIGCSAGRLRPVPAVEGYHVDPQLTAFFQERAVNVGSGCLTLRSAAPHRPQLPAL